MSTDERRCVLCEASLDGLRPHAVYCGSSCRARASEIRRRSRDSHSAQADRQEALRDAREAQASLRRAIKRINARYALVRPDKRPDVNGPAWTEHDHAIDAALTARDFDTGRKVIAAWERFAFAELSPEEAS